MTSWRLTRRRLLKILGASAATLLGPGVSRSFENDNGSAMYRNPDLPIDDRVKDLLGRMTLEEKVAQMYAVWASKADIMEGLDFAPSLASKAYPDGFGQLSRPSDKRGGPGIGAAAGGTAARWRTPKNTVEFINAIQKWATEETRLGIPVLFHEESLHGYMATEATAFPQAIALAGTFDTELVREINSVIAREVRARGVPLVLSPVVDIVRDPRWGRIEETFGEDPFLTAEMGVAAVEGLQGTGDIETLADDKVFATLKHMTGHGQPEAGNNIAPAPISERELRENFFPPFRRAVERTAIASVMPSYNEIDGVPSHKNRWLLNDVLRKEWGFDGIIVSDYYGIEELQRIHGVAADYADAARQALEAGVDVELPDNNAYASLVDLVNSGKVSESLIDTAVERILRFKFRAGLFENPYGDFALADAITGNDEARDLALTAARKSLCLLTNDGTLPFDKASLGKLAVIGPNANIARLGGYSSVPRSAIPLLQGIRELVGSDVDIVHAQGVFITQSEDRAADEVLLPDPEDNRKLIREAVEAARGVDAIVLAIGDTEQTSREGFAEDHLGDRTDIDILGEQNELFDALRALGKPVVVCAINGRPPSWPNIVDKANALLECWYPGQEGGTAMAEALFGEINPGAKLAVSVVRNEGQIPYFYNHKPSARRGYLFDDATPLFPFGHGLSYTTFDIAAPVLSAERIATDESVAVSVTVKNTGSIAGDEVIQVYLRDRMASVAQPVKKLVAFRRVSLEPGESATVEFGLGPATFSIWDLDMREVVEPGLLDIMVGPDSEQLKSIQLELTES
jgi:beta-glucosidase